MTRASDIYVKNKSGVPQSFRHLALRGVLVLPCAPGGYINVNQATFTVEPDQAVRVPVAVWNTTPALCRKEWTEKITEHEFLALSSIGNALIPGDDRPWFLYSDRKVRVDKVTEKRVYFTDEAGVEGWADTEKWEAHAAELVEEVSPVICPHCGKDTSEPVEAASEAGEESAPSNENPVGSPTAEETAEDTQEAGEETADESED
jgi:hypothetical protein